MSHISHNNEPARISKIKFKFTGHQEYTAESDLQTEHSRSAAPNKSLSSWIALNVCNYMMYSNARERSLDRIVFVWSLCAVCSSIYKMQPPHFTDPRAPPRRSHQPVRPLNEFQCFVVVVVLFDVGFNFVITHSTTIRLWLVWINQNRSASNVSNKNNVQNKIKHTRLCQIRF